MADILGLVRARPKSIRIREIWNTSSTLGAHSVHKFEPSVAVEAEVAVPLDNPQPNYARSSGGLDSGEDGKAHRVKLRRVRRFTKTRREMIRPSAPGSDTKGSGAQAATAAPSL